MSERRDKIRIDKQPVDPVPHDPGEEDADQDQGHMVDTVDAHGSISL